MRYQIVLLEKDDQTKTDLISRLKKYGNVEYADNINKKYPIDEKHIKSAVSYFAKPDNYHKYAEKERKSIAKKIMKAAKKFLPNFDHNNWIEKFGLKEKHYEEV